MKKSILYLTLLIILCSSAIINKNYFAELVEEKLEEYTTSFAPEKIYIHTDKPYYALDETIWFSSYLVNGVSHEKTDKSWVIYVELFNNKDSLVSKKTLFTNSLSVGGDIKIEKQWGSGNYVLQAYTNYMKNDGPDYFFKKEIRVFDPNVNIPIKTHYEKSADTKQFKQIKPNLKFYPEGGDLVGNIRSKVALKIDNIGLNDVTINGTIVNDQNKVIASFITTEFGLGIFTISPKPNTNYRALVSINGVEYSYKLPKAIPKGSTLSILNETDHIVVNVASNEDIGLTNTYLIAHQRGKQLFNKFQTKAKQTYTIKIPNANLKDGVVHVTLFDSSGNPVCERLLYISREDNVGKVEISKVNDVLGTRKKQTISITSKDANGDVMPSNMSVSIRDLSAFPYNRYNKNIKTYLLLNSDLRGEIKNPGYFFDGEFTKKKQYLLDLLMLTNGWRRFTWKLLLFNKKSNEFNAEKGLFISGKTYRLKKPYGPVSAETKIAFQDKNTITQTAITKSSPQGNFKFGPFIFFDSIPIIVESRLTNFESENEKDRDVHIIIDREKTKGVLDRNKITGIDDIKNTQLENYLKATKYVSKLNGELEKRREQLDEVTVVAQKVNQLEAINEEMNNLTDYGRPTNRLDFEYDFREYGLTVIDMLKTLPGVNVFSGDDENAVTTDGENGVPIDKVRLRGSNNAPYILLDGFPVNESELNMLRTDEVSFVDILKGADAAFYSRSSGGVIAVYTKGRNSRKLVSKSVKYEPGIIDFTAQGFYTAKEFYSPDYTSGFEAAQPDIRTTLYWAPKVVVDSTKIPKELSFFTSDSKGDYLIEVEGISASGIPLQATSIFSVE